ncbi:amidohydrolase family protein [Elongatibacter sediminis]|uniref:Amidohydrolase family protein n=1 Tax=Elongatibacter sediminis TaxID=3119006 RepID=A0AAW9R8H4_9GAMM
MKQQDKPIRIRLLTVLITALFVCPGGAAAQSSDTDPLPAPPRAEGEGPFDRLAIRNATLIDGSGAPAGGPVDILIEGNRIAAVVKTEYVVGDMRPADAPEPASHEIDATGMYVLPGFVDLHLHSGDTPKTPQAEYVYKLWLAHGITTGRGVPFASPEFSESEKRRSARNEITAPRMFTYRLPFDEWEGTIETPEKARAWVRSAAKTGIDGLKLTAYPPDIMEALIDEAKKLGLGTTAHLSQTGVANMNARDAARLGLGTLTHFYGLFESLYKDHRVQTWPAGYNNFNEQERFAQVARQWTLVHERGSDEWKALLAEFKSHDLTLDPTFTTYIASRDVARSRTSEWHERYTLPSLWDFYIPSQVNHGSYFYDWTTWDEVAWKNFYRVWMAFVNDYKNMGGRVTVSSDAGYIYNTFGFATIEEMELLQEAGFHPLEVIRAATLHGAQTLFEPKGEPIQFGVVRAGLLADLVIVPEDPIANLKVLYGTGTERLNHETGEVERVGGIRYTIKDGIVYDARELLADVARMVEAQKAERAAIGDSEPLSVFGSGEGFSRSRPGSQ